MINGYKKIILVIFLVLSFDIARDVNFRRLNETVLLQKYQYNSTDKIETLKSLSAHDLQQAVENSGRLFIRDKIILP